MGCYGNDWIETPHLDALAERSVVYENCYVTQPVCAPARASIMTGLYPHSHGVTGNNAELRPGVPTLAEMMPAGYECGYFGKWHLGHDTVAQRGFTKWRSLDDFQLVRSDDGHPEEPDYNGFLRRHGVDPPGRGEFYERWLAGQDLPEHLTQAAYLGGEVVEFIADRKGSDQPFLLFVAFSEPHPPYTGPLDDLYDPDEIAVGPAFLEPPRGGAAVNRLRAEYYLAGGLNPLGVAGGDTHDTTTESGWRRLRSRYFANVTLVDRQIGRIVEALERSGRADDTMIVFTSEHGEMAGDHGMLEKRTMYEEATRVPLLVHLPGQTAQARVGGSVSQVDLAPTLLVLAGGVPPDHLEGRAQNTALDDRRTDAAGADAAGDVFVQWNGEAERDLGSQEINRLIKLPWRTIVSGRWKLNLCVGDQCELFDLTSDPHEMLNLFDDPLHRPLVSDLAARLREWQMTVGDVAPLPQV